jgi:hypothetical protein
MFAIDCEMVLTAKDRSELARVAVINEKLEVRIIIINDIENDVNRFIMLIELTSFS